MSKQTEEGSIRYFNSQDCELIKSDLSADKAADIWLALHKQAQDSVDPCSAENHDPLSKQERDLYSATTKILTEAAFLPMTYTVSETNFDSYE